MALMDAALNDNLDDDGEESSDGQPSSQDIAMSNPDYRSFIFRALGQQDPQAQLYNPTAAKDSSSSSSDDLLKSLAGGGRQTQKPPRQQIRNLQQLGEAAKALQHLPDDIKKKVLSHLLGIPFDNPKDLALQNSLAPILFRHQLTEPERQQRQQLQQQVEGRRQESLSNRERQQAMLMQLRKRQARRQEAYRSNALQAHRESARNQLANSISNLTRAMEMTTDPEQKSQLAKMLLKQHKAYQSFADYEGGLEEKQQQKDSEGDGEVSNGEY